MSGRYHAVGATVNDTSLGPLLREHPFLIGFTRDHIAFMVSCATSVHFTAGDFLLREGDPADHVLLLRAGTVALELYVPGPGVRRVETLTAGDIVGYSWLFPPSRWSLDARALTEVRALRFDGACLRQKMEEDRHFGYELTVRLLRHLTSRLDRVHLQQVDAYHAE